MPIPDSKPETRSIEAQIEIAASIEAVWKALADAEEMTRWFPLQAGVNPDGTTWMAWNNDFRFEGRFEIFDPPRHLRSVPLPPKLPEGAQSAVTNPADAPPAMATDVFLETRGGKTVVRLVHSGFSAAAAWDEEFEGTWRGWQFQLLNLKLYLERHPGTPRRVAWARRVLPFTIEQLSLAEAWDRVMGPKGLAREGRPQNAKEGDRFSFQSATGDELSGTVHAFEPPINFVARVENWNDALLRVQFDVLPMRGVRDVSLWLSTYGVPAEKVDALRDRWRVMLDRLFA